MINFKNFDRKKLFKSKAKIAILILLVTLATSSIFYLGVKIITNWFITLILPLLASFYRR
jgi:hypothetical protein